MMTYCIDGYNDPIDQFFAYLRERQSIFLKKEKGLPWPWTTDPILQKYKFCSVFREDDKTTRWFRTNVRDKLKHNPEVFLATVMFRMFNRIETGDIIFNKTDAFEQFLKNPNAEKLEKIILSLSPKGPWITGAYIITSPTGFTKLRGVCNILETFAKGRWGDKNETWQEFAYAILNLQGVITLEDVWEYLRTVPFMGGLGFHAYEIVTDLRHTSLLDCAPDINTWANAGPGAHRGLTRIFNPGGSLARNDKWSRQESLDLMIKLLELSKDTKYWSNNDKYPSFELRDIEHGLCELDKYNRVYTGLGRPRSIYRKV